MKIIGHRGAKGLAPENTLVSFQKALDHHVDEIELDVRVTQDQEVVLSHDSDVHDPAGNKLRVSSHTLEELRLHKPDLITLAEAMDFINKRIPMLIEIKPDVIVPPIIAAIQAGYTNGWATHDLIPGSFDQAILREVRTALPNAPLVVIEGWSGTKAVLRAHQVNTKRLNMRSWWLWKGFLRSMQKRGWQIAPYTMNNPSKVKKWQPYLYGVITDYPDLFEK